LTYGDYGSGNPNISGGRNDYNHDDIDLDELKALLDDGYDSKIKK
jgi:hypothetical protein